jgi:hypothetical protein
VKRLANLVEELRLGMDANRRQLPLLGETQRKNRETLDSFKAELKRRIEALPPDMPQLAPLAESASQFLLELDIAEPETHMDAASRNAAEGRTAETFQNAELARAALERLLKQEDNLFADAARGEAPEFNIPDLDQALQQLLEGLLQQNPGGDGAPGQGEALGGQGMPGGGFPMHMPMVGPSRMQFGHAPGSGGEGGDGPAAGAAPLPESAESGTLPPTDTRQTSSSAPDPESIPEPYRESVRKFLTP